MTKQQLHDPQVSAVIQQVRGKCMAQHMGRYFGPNTGDGVVVLDAMPERLAGHGAPLATGEQGMALVVLQQLSPGTLDVLLQPLMGALSHGHQTLLPAFAGNTDNALTPVDVVHVQMHQFRNSQAARVQQLQHGAITQTNGGSGIRAVQQRFNLTFRQGFWQCLALAGHIDMGRDVAASLLRLQQVAIKRSQRGNLPCG